MAIEEEAAQRLRVASIAVGNIGGRGVRIAAAGVSLGRIEQLSNSVSTEADLPGEMSSGPIVSDRRPDPTDCRRDAVSAEDAQDAGLHASLPNGAMIRANRSVCRQPAL